MRNRIALYTVIDGDPVSHFHLSEFENHDGWCMVHPSVLRSLEMTRFQLNKQFPLNPVYIIITGSTRTEAHNNELGKAFGWTDQGGIVSRNSKHLEKYGGIAVDFVARHGNGDRVDQKTVGNAARLFFDFVIDDYKDGHIHADNREHL